MQSTLVTQKSTILFSLLEVYPRPKRHCYANICNMLPTIYLFVWSIINHISFTKISILVTIFFNSNVSNMCSYSCDGHKLLNSNITNISNVFSIFSYVSQIQNQISVCTLKCWSHIFKFKYHKCLK